jgi:hypothetical protein
VFSLSRFSCTFALPFHLQQSLEPVVDDFGDCLAQFEIFGRIISGRVLVLGQRILVYDVRNYLPDTICIDDWRMEDFLRFLLVDALVELFGDFLVSVFSFS